MKFLRSVWFIADFGNLRHKCQKLTLQPILSPPSRFSGKMNVMLSCL